MTLRVLLVLAAMSVLPPRVPWPRWRIGALGALFVLLPPLGVAAVAARLLFERMRRLSRERAAASSADGDVVLLGELVGLGLSAGLTLPGALRVAGAELGGLLGAEINDVGRVAVRVGSAAALESAQGRGSRLYRLLGRAAATGAPVGLAVEAFLGEQRGEERSRQLAAARKLPVKLLFPLALLILPGFLVLTVGPSLLGALDRLAL